MERTAGRGREGGREGGKGRQTKEGREEKCRVESEDLTLACM